MDIEFDVDIQVHRWLEEIAQERLAQARANLRRRGIIATDATDTADDPLWVNYRGLVGEWAWRHGLGLSVEDLDDPLPAYPDQDIDLWLPGGRSMEIKTVASPVLQLTICFGKPVVFLRDTYGLAAVTGWDGKRARRVRLMGWIRKEDFQKEGYPTTKFSRMGTECWTIRTRLLNHPVLLPLHQVR